MSSAVIGDFHKLTDKELATVNAGLKKKLIFGGMRFANAAIECRILHLVR